MQPWDRRKKKKNKKNGKKRTKTENTFPSKRSRAGTRGPSKLVARSRNLFNAFNTRRGRVHNSPRDSCVCVCARVFRRKRREVAFTVEESSLSYFSNETRYRTSPRLSFYFSSLHSPRSHFIRVSSLTYANDSRLQTIISLSLSLFFIFPS